jgi:uncharacterized protein YoxC
MAHRKKILDKLSQPLVGMQHRWKQAWREVQSQISDRLDDLDAWAVEQVNDSLDSAGTKVSHAVAETVDKTLATAKESLQGVGKEISQKIGKRSKPKR